MTIELWQEQPKSKDYITVKGLTGILAIRENELPDFLLQEIFDNALDWIDSNVKDFIKLDKKPYTLERSRIEVMLIKKSNHGKQVRKRSELEQPIKWSG